jgi:hypothetical protein
VISRLHIAVNVATADSATEDAPISRIAINDGVVVVSYSKRQIMRHQPGASRAPLVLVGRRAWAIFAGTLFTSRSFTFE